MKKKSFCMECRTWRGEDPTGSLMSEKLDGIRMIRPAGSLFFVSREGVQFTAPAWWLAQFPQDGSFLDGEAFAGRRMFRLVQHILEQPCASDEEWGLIKLNMIQPRLRHGSVMEPMKQTFCRGIDHLREFESNVRSLGGEGVVIRHPNQPYHFGRSPYLLKIAPTQKELDAMRLPLSECLKMVRLAA